MVPESTDDAGTDVEEFLRRATAPGTDGALMCLFAPPPANELVAVVLALRDEIGRSLAPDLAPEVAATRLAWWGEEAGRTVAGQPRHPLTRRLAAGWPPGESPGVPHLGALLAEMVGAAQAALSDPLPQDWPRLVHRLEHDWGAACRLIATVLSAEHAPWHAGWANALGVAVALDEALMAGEALPPLQPSNTPPGASLEQSWRDQVCAYLAQAKAALPPAQRNAQRPLLVLAALLHARVRRPPPAARPKHRHLAHAMGRVWLAWRTAQHAARGEWPRALRGL